MLDTIIRFFLDMIAWLISLITAGSITLYEPPAPPEIPDVPDVMTQEITVMSFNIYSKRDGDYAFDGRINGVVETILNEKPDSVGLQEAHDAWRFNLWKNLDDEYGWACWAGRDFGFGEAVPILYRKDKYILLEESVFWLSETPRFPSVGWDAALRRVAGYAVLQDRETGFTYVHFNSHFDHVGEIARANSARLVADRINEMNLPAVFTADVNARPNTLPTNYLEAGGLINLRGTAAVSDTGSTFHAYSGGIGNSIIDHIYANHYLREAAYFKVIRDKYDGLYPSDHFAISAKLTLAN